MLDLEREIEAATRAVEDRKSRIDGDISTLTSKIENFTCIAWILVALGFIILVLASWYYTYYHVEREFRLNLLGDFLSGSVASIWSLAGLFFVYVAFLGQKQQLLHQQLEILFSQLEVKFTRLELAGQKQEMQEQNKTLRLQKFENTFFQMIALFNSIVNSIDLRNNNTKLVTNSGRDCFRAFYNSIYKCTENILPGEYQLMVKSSIEDSIAGYTVFYNHNKSDLSHYFRTLYHIIKFIDGSEIEMKNQYISIIRSQLSSYEQIVLFYNCLHSNGSEKFKPLIEKYALLKNIDTSLLFNPAHIESYEPGAFGKSKTASDVSN